MRKLISSLALVALVLALLMVNLDIAVASNGATQQYGPISSTSPDSGTCGNDWATDTFDRFYKVNTTTNPDGTYTVTEEFKNGTFVTNAGASPGSCQPGNTPALLGAGVTGKMQGTFTIIVTGGTFNPDATCTQVSCGTTAGFIATVFGSTATYDVPTFLFHYSAGNNGEWKNASPDQGGNNGDITGAP